MKDINLIKIANEISRYINEIKVEKDLSKVIGFHSGDTTRLIDKKSEEYIFELFKNTGFKFRFVSEESGVVEEENYDYTAVIDPLDGSMNFVLDVPWYSVSVALYDNNGKEMLDSIAGFVVHIPSNTIYSYDEKSAYINGQVFKPYESSYPIILTYFDKEVLDKIVKIFSLLDNFHEYKIRSLGSSSLDMILLCIGKAYMFLDLRGKIRNVDISASSNFCSRLNIIPIDLMGKKINTKIDNVYKIKEIIMSRDEKLLKNIYSIFS
ncbi:MAG: inositol monophosphatase family protein [Saccharolobus sp.]